MQAPKTEPIRSRPRGVALTIVIMVIIMLGLLGGYVTQLGYNQKRLMNLVSGKRVKIYYRAQAGVINATWRIRANYTTGLAPAGNFTTDTYDPNPYNIDIDGDAVNDVTVDIFPVSNALTKERRIDSLGLDP